MRAKINHLKLGALIILLMLFCSFGFFLIKLRRQEESLEQVYNKDLDNRNGQPKMQDIFNRSTNGYARGVYIAGDYAYVAVGDYGLAIIDISDPTNPGTPVYKNTSGEARSVFVAGNYAFVADMSSGLAIIDISNPSSPGSVYYESTSGYATDVYIEGDYAYVIDESSGSGLVIIDISDPTNPGPTKYLNTPGYSNGIFVDGNYAYTSELSSFQANNGLRSHDISDPTNPTFADHRETFTYWVRSVYVAGDYAYVAAGPMDLAVIDISDPNNMGQPRYANGPGAVSYDVYVSGDYAYLAVDTNGMGIIDISDPVNPSSPIYVDTPGNARGICVEGDYAYLGDGNNGLVIIKIGEIIDPEPPYYQSLTNANAVQVVGDYAYVAGSDLAVVNISDPTNPGPVYHESSAWYSSVYVSGNYAYLTDDLNDHFRVVDITDPTNPTFLAFDFLLPFVYDVFVEGDFAYVAYSDGLFIVNISDPSDPNPIRIKTLDRGLSVHVEGNYAYVAAGGSGLAVVDISDPENPGTVYYEDTSGWAVDVYTEGDYAYVADESSGLAIIDISNPTNPGTPVYEDTNGNANGVWISGNYAYVASGSSGLAVIDISDPTSPGAPVYRDTSNAIGVCVEGDYAYIADWNDGLVIMKIMNPWYILETPILDLIPPGPYYDGLIDLNWNDIIGATKYYVYRAYTPIITLRGRTPLTTVIDSMYQDTVFSNTTYYYAITAVNNRGNSFLSNFRYVAVTIDNQAPGSFSVVYPSGWITNQTPTVISKFHTDLSGVDVSTVQYAYSNDGTLNPNNWASVNGVYYDEECENFAYDGRTGWIYVKVDNVQFNMDSGTDNTIRFRASDMVGNQGTQGSASIIQIDTTKPGSFSLYSPTSLVADQTPSVVAQFYTATSGVNISTVEYAYSTSGESAPTNWAPVDGVFKNYFCTTPANNSDTGWIYAKVDNVPFNQDSTSLNTIRYRATDMAGNPSSVGNAVIIQVDTIGPTLFSVYSPENEVDDQTPTVIIKLFISDSGIDVSTVEYAYSTTGELAPTNWMMVDGVYTNAECTNLAIDGATGWLFAKMNLVPFNKRSLTQNMIRLRAKDMLGNLGIQENAVVIPITQKGGITIENIIILVVASSIALVVVAITTNFLIRPSPPPKRYELKPIGYKNYLGVNIQKTPKSEEEIYMLTYQLYGQKGTEKFDQPLEKSKLNKIQKNYKKLLKKIKDKALKKDRDVKIDIDNIKELGSNIYSSLIIKNLQSKLESLLPEFRTIELSLGTQFVQYPWELFHFGDTFLSLHCALGRSVDITGLEKAPNVPIPSTKRENIKILIIADPEEKSSLIIPQVMKLKKKLNKIRHVNVEFLKGKESTCSKVREKLREGADFIHFFGHAHSSTLDPCSKGKESRIQLSDGTLKTSEIAEAISNQRIPFLVFINACESGQEGEWKKLKYANEVFGLPSSFILNNVQGFIGTLWPIHSKQAAYVAEVFYKELFRKKSFGEALKIAKKTAFEKLKKSSFDWASYVLFGDPTLTLEKIKKKKCKRVKID